MGPARQGGGGWKRSATGRAGVDTDGYDGMMKKWIEFFREVRYETNKVTWPTRRETIVTGVMVLIFSAIMGLFFFIVDLFVGLGIRTILGLGA